jgi:predicted DNA-binding transcriptional regulator AlpA
MDNQDNNKLPDKGFLRLYQIIGDTDKGIPPLIPISRSAWYAGIKAGRYPKQVKISPNVALWRVEDIRALLDSLKVRNYL